MSKRSLITFLALCAAFVGFSPVAANAGTGCDLTFGIECGHVYHVDAGLDKQLAVRCDYGVVDSKQYVSKGNSDTCHDMDQIYVYSGTELWCRYYSAYSGYYWSKEMMQLVGGRLTTSGRSLAPTAVTD